VSGDLCPDAFYRKLRPQKAVDDHPGLAQYPQQNVLGLNIGRAELAGLLAREEDHAPGLFRVAFEHFASWLPAEDWPPAELDGLRLVYNDKDRANRELRGNCASAGCAPVPPVLFGNWETCRVRA
jgi:hypothetical protein